MLRACLLALLACSCDPRNFAAVGATGVYQPDAGCTVREEGGSACPSGAQFAFETPEARFSTATHNLSNLRVTCEHSLCGTGSLALHASYHWHDTAEQGPDKLGEIRYAFPTPIEMIGKQLSFSVRVDPLNTPINGMIAVISNGWHKVDDAPVLGRGWNTKGGVVGPESMNWEGLATAKSVMVSEIRISVYLATPVHNSSDGNWQGEIYVDEVGWR